LDDNLETCRSICSTSAFASSIIDRPSVIQPRATPTAHHWVDFYDRCLDLRE
jgi:hypothetical protein